MRPITSDSPVSTGDVLYNPALGFARVVGVDPVGLRLEWHQQGPRLPRRVSQEAAAKGYRACAPEGFFALAVLDSAGLKDLMARDPGAAILLLLEELEDPQETSAIDQWLQRVCDLDGEALSALWDRVRPEHDPRFRSQGGRIGLRLSVDSDPDITAPLPVFPLESRSWAELPPLRGQEILHTGMELMGLLAQPHARGRGVGLSDTSLTQDPDGHLQLEELDGTPANDVLVAGRLLLQRILDRELPRGLPPHRILPFLASLAEPLPPGALPLLEAMLAPTASRRPSTALGPYAAWAAAAALEEVRSSAPLGGRCRLEVGADTHVGRYKARTHQTNQDAWTVCEDDDATLLVVCDGISTSDAGSGDQASRIAVRTLEDLWERRPAHLDDRRAVEAFLLDSLRAANRAIVEAATQAAGGDLTGRIPMGTTLVLALVHGQTADLMALGDSRIYLMTRGGAAVLTPDQNVELEWLQQRRARREAERMSQALVGYLGHQEESRGPVLLPPWSRRLRLLDGESLVLMSDGIVDYAASTHIELLGLLEEALSDQPAEEAAAQLVMAANRGGGGDNATALVARLTVR